MSIPKLAAVALLMTVAAVGWSQTSPEDHAAHHPPENGQTTTPAVAMGELLERAEHAKTVAERERLLDEHLAAMRKQLDSLKSQQCAMEKMDGTSMGSAPSNGAMPGMMMCHQMMKSRMDTMTELLEQTWRREELRKKDAK